MENRNLLKREWKKRIRDAWYHQKGGDIEKKAYIDSLAALLITIQPHLYPYFTIGKVINKYSSGLAKMAYEIHSRQPDVSERTVRIANRFVENYCSGIPTVSSLNYKSQELSDIAE